MIIATNVVCRDQPSVSSATAGAFGLGDQLFVSQMREVEGEDWYLVRSRTSTFREFDSSSRPRDCWVAGSLTTPFDSSNPEPALVALADHALDNQAATFEDVVAAENVLTAASMAAVLASSARLEARRLLLIDRALSRPKDLRAPLTQSWMRLHQQSISYWSIGLAWYVRPEVYWQAYESFEGAEGAEDIAWAAANASVFFDECYINCRLLFIARTRMQYWTRFPDGQYLEEALSFAASQAELAASHCILVSTDYIQMDLQQTRDLVDELKDSLESVSANEKVTLLAPIAEIEQDCLNSQVSGPDDPLAIPGLTKALGTGFIFVPHQLAQFGESAVPGVIEVLEDPEADQYAISDALRVLRFMVQLNEVDALSDDALQEIRVVAEQWLTKPEQTMSTLLSAVDLAVVLDDSDLRDIVESLTADRNEVLARGVQEDSSVEFVQRLARERLAFGPPLPRF